MIQMKTRAFNEVLTHLLGFILSLALVILISVPSSAQMLDPNSQIRNLKEGTLYVVIPTFNKKLAALRDQLSRADLPKSASERTKKLISETIYERDSFAHALKQAFEFGYHFSNYDLIQDLELPKFLEEMEASQKAMTFFLDHSTTENGAKALIISNHKREPLNRPFPYFARTGRSSSVFEAVFGAKDTYWRDLTKVIQKFDQKLSKYHQKYH